MMRDTLRRPMSLCY